MMAKQILSWARQASTRHVGSNLLKPWQRVPSTSSFFIRKESNKSDIKIDYQDDIRTLGELEELIEFWQSDKVPDSQRQITSINLLKAATVYADRPWWTARHNGKLVGYMIATKIGQSYSSGSYMYVTPDYRGHDIGAILHKWAFGSLKVEEDIRSYTLAFGSSSGRGTFDKGVERPYVVDFDIIVKMGQIVNDPKCIRPSENLQGFEIKTLERGPLFDKLIAFDSGFIHPAPRPVFLEYSLDPKVVKTFVAVDTATGAVLGYACHHPAMNPDFTLFGPVYATRDDIAGELLYQTLSDSPKGKNFVLYYTSENNYIAKAATQVFGEKIAIEGPHGGTGPYPVPYNHQHIYCLHNSTVVLA